MFPYKKKEAAWYPGQVDLDPLLKVGTDLDSRRRPWTNGGWKMILSYWGPVTFQNFTQKWTIWVT